MDLPDLTPWKFEVENYETMFNSVADNVMLGFLAIVPAGFGIYAFKYIWRVGKSFFQSLAR